MLNDKLELLVDNIKNYQLFKNKKGQKHFYLTKKDTTLSPKRLLNFQKNISDLKQEVKNLKQDISELTKEKEKISDEIKFIDEAIKDSSRQKLIKETLELERNNAKASKQKSLLQNDINKLSFQKEMLRTEIEELEEKKKKVFLSEENIPITIEYIDNLTSGLEFEKYFATLLDKLGYTNIEITSGSGDFGIDVLASKEDVIYGFQCKLYSNVVGNDAIQQAHSGRTHYNCNVAIVVTNNYFSEQAKQQATETQVILWDRDTLVKKISQINK